MAERDVNLQATDGTLEQVECVRSGPTLHPRSGFLLDPATGALVVSPNLDRKIRKALMREVRRMRYALYLLKARLYLETLWLKGARAVLQMRDHCARHF